MTGLAADRDTHCLRPPLRNSVTNSVQLRDHSITYGLHSCSLSASKSRSPEFNEIQKGWLAGWLPSASNPANGPWKLRQCPKSQQILTIPATAKRVWPKIDKVCSRNIQMHAGTSIFRDYRKHDGRRHKYIHWGVQKPRRLTAAKRTPQSCYHHASVRPSVRLSYITMMQDHAAQHYKWKQKSVSKPEIGTPSSSSTKTTKQNLARQLTPIWLHQI